MEQNEEILKPGEEFTPYNGIIRKPDGTFRIEGKTTMYLQGRMKTFSIKMDGPFLDATKAYGKIAEFRLSKLAHFYENKRELKQHYDNNDDN